MLIQNSKSNLLEEDGTNFQAVSENSPELYRHIFPYNKVPMIPFDDTTTPLNMPKDIWITDTSFRDGQQSRSPYTVEQIVHLFKLLHRLGGEKGIIRQTEFFVYSKKDVEALNRCMELGFTFPEITTWIRASKSDFELVKNIGVKETGILVSCSDYHIFKKLKMNRAQALDHYLSVIKDALSAGLRPRCHFEDITRADFEGFVSPFVNALMELSKESGVPIKIRACDTLGFGVPYPGVALPRSVPAIIHGLHHHLKVPSELLEWHGHNDFYKGVACATAAWLYGASAVNCSLLGIGERTGNVPLEAMIIEYASLKGTTDGVDTTIITEIAKYFESDLGYSIPEMTPFIGKNFNVTKAGVHADGLLKDEEIYNIFDTHTLLNRPVSVTVNNTSGLAGIAYWINQHFNLSGIEKIEKHDILVTNIREWVEKEYDLGRQTVISDIEMTQLIEKFALDRY